MKTLLAKWLLVVSAVLATPSADACECHERPSAKEDLEASDTVFAGKVLSSRVSTDDREFVHQIEVTALYKGYVQRVTEVVTPATTCGFPFEQGKSYLVFSTGHGSKTVTRCGATHVLDSANTMPRWANS
jgi:hypothetical protein